eukprot:7261312-Prymnesium_polylepis.1
MANVRTLRPALLLEHRLQRAERLRLEVHPRAPPLPVGARRARLAGGRRERVFVQQRADEAWRLALEEG